MVIFRHIALTCLLAASLLLAAGWPPHAHAQQTGASFRFTNITLRASLDSLMRRFPVSIVYLDRDVEGKMVTASCDACGLEQALNAVLSGTPLTWIRMGNQVVLRQRIQAPPRLLTTISGTVTDSLTGAWIAGASVMLQEGNDTPPRQWCPSNDCGFYSLRDIPPGVYTMVVRAIGYEPLRISVRAEDGTLLQRDLALQPQEITMKEVTVEGIRAAVASAEGFSRGVYIRSAPSDQNQYLLDGMRVYNPAHFGGVLNSFNNEALNDVQASNGGIPPYYGGRIGSVMDLSLREGNMERVTGSAGTGSLGSHAAIEGPLSEEASFLVSARRAYPDAWIPFLNGSGPAARLGSSELMAKLSGHLSPSSRLFLSGYVGRDSYDNVAEGYGRTLRNDFSWGNSAVSLRWTGIASPSLFLQASGAYTRYSFTLHHAVNAVPQSALGTLALSNYMIEDVSVRAHAEHYYDRDNTLIGGAELVQHRMRGQISRFSTQIAPLLLDSRTSWELAVYLEDQWRLVPDVTAELGARAASFTGPAGTFSAVDPRLSLRVAVNGQSLVYASLNAVNQFIHPYRNSGVFLLYPSIFWYPSTEQIKPSTAIQAIVGYERSMDNERYLFSVEPYYRVIQNLHEFRHDLTDAPALTDGIVSGTGRSYGVAFSIQKRIGTLSGSARYTLSWEDYAFPGGGESFPAPFDRRHELRAEILYRPSENWLFGALCVLASAQQVAAAPLAQSIDSRGHPGVGATMPDVLSLIDVNGSRVPGFQRLELSALRSFSLWGLSSQVTLRLVNGYGLLDPFAWQLMNTSDADLQWRASLRKISLFPLYPTLGMSVRF